MSHRNSTLTALIFLVAVGSAAGQPFSIAKDTSLEVTLLQAGKVPKTWTVSATSMQAHMVAAWLQKNTAGWSEYVATPPAAGVLIDATTLRLQFVGNTALACESGRACVAKKVEPGEYEFLTIGPAQ